MESEDFYVFRSCNTIAASFSLFFYSLRNLILFRYVRWHLDMKISLCFSVGI